MVRIIPEENIKYKKYEISEESIGTVLKDLKSIEKKIGKKAGYISKNEVKKFQTDITKIRANLIGAIKPVG